MEGALPAGLIEEMNDGMQEEADAVAERSLLILIARLNKRPIDEQWPADDILAWHEPPITAVQADCSVVAHREIFTLGHHQVFALNVRRQFDRPARGHVARFIR